MPDLIARGGNPENQWRETLPQGLVTLGRTARSHWKVAWDSQISGLHAHLLWQDGKLLVRKEPRAVNKIFFHGQEAEEFTLKVGDKFTIGETDFILEESEPTPVSELTISPQELRQVKYSDPDDRIAALAALPGLIRYSPTDRELEERVVEVLLQGIPRADAAAVLRLAPASPAVHPEVEARCVKGRDGTASDLQLSHRLVHEAVQVRRQCMANVWYPDLPRGDYTPLAGSDWAICVPLLDGSSVGWALYLTGHLREELPPSSTVRDDLLKGDLKFAELVGDVFGSLRQVRDLQRRHALLERFFSQPVRTALAERDMDEVLRPRPTEVTVLFCDLRGSCRLAEEGQDNLTALWDHVSQALDVMASSIIDLGGVIGDFQGDAAMGFWGWPLECGDQVERAARAALNIRRRFVHAAQQGGAHLGAFRCGIGLAHGPAIAGRLGTFDQFKVDVFGPVVNLASRLESLTKLFKVPILTDEQVAHRLSAATTGPGIRCRRLARLRPYGMNVTLVAHELLPPMGEAGAMSDQAHRDYEAGLDAFLTGRWPDALRLLNRLPQDGAAQFLKDFMDRHHQTVPENWDGVIVMESK